MKKLLVTTDLSEESRAAFEVARTLAQALHMEVHLLAIIEDPAQAAMIYALDFPVLPNPDVQEQLVAKVSTDLAAIIEKEFSGLNCQYYVCEASGPVTAEISAFVETHAIDLVVLATHGRTGLSRLLIGSVAERVVRDCPCPVLTVPCKQKAPS